MTDWEKAVVMAYTGTCMLAGDKLSIFYEYIQDKLGHSVMTHELAYPEVQDAIKEAAYDDFIELCKSSDEPRLMTLDEAKSTYVIEYRSGKMREVGSKLLDLNVDPLNAEYGKIYRVWTSRPDEKRREEMPWN